MRLIQLMGDNIEELWEFPDGITDEQIEDMCEKYLESDDHDSLEEFMEQEHPEIKATRVFVDEIYV